ncbi:MAG: hypothetical protein R3F20_08280 [Planctomycetota bacterium]
MNLPTRIVLSLLLLFGAAKAQTLDQQNSLSLTGSGEIFLYGASSGSNATSAGQSFTVGQTGRLSRIEVAVEDVNGSGTLSITLYPFNPTGCYFANPPLANIMLDHSQVPNTPTWLGFDLPGSIAVTPGEQFVIHVRALNSFGGNAAFGWLLSPGSDYPAGSLVLNGPFYSCFGGSNDGGFRTYVGNLNVSPAAGLVHDFQTNDGAWTAGGPWTFATTGGAVNGGRHARIQSGAPGLTTAAFTSALIDFDTALPNAEMTFQYHAWDTLVGGLTHTLQIEVDRNDGLGFVAVPGATYSQPTGPGIWVPAAITLPDVGGRTGVRIRAVATVETFNLIFTNYTSTVGFDEVTISTPYTIVTPSAPYLCDFESNDAWMSTDPTWQKGLPFQNALFGARSGVTAWATGLNTNYAPNTTATLSSPVFELREFTGHATCEFAVNSRLAAGDSLVVLYDRFDGMGPQPLPFGSIVGDSGGWVVRRVDLPLTMGEGGGRLHFEFSSDGMAEDEGVAIDEVRIFQPAYEGSASREGDDLTMEVFINGQLEYGVGDSFTMLAGENVTIRGSSGSGSLDGAQYYLIGELYNGPMTFQKAAVDIWFALGGGTFVLDGGAEAPFFVPVGLSPFGETWSFTYPGGAPGWNCLVQAVVVDPLKVQSGFYASANAFRIQFN